MHRCYLALIAILLCACAAHVEPSASSAQPPRALDAASREQIDALSIKAAISKDVKTRFKAFKELYELSGYDGYLLQAASEYAHTCQAARIEYGCIDADFERLVFDKFSDEINIKILKLRSLIAQDNPKANELLKDILKQDKCENEESLRLALSTHIGYKKFQKLCKHPNDLARFYIASMALEDLAPEWVLEYTKTPQAPYAKLLHLQALLMLKQNPSRIDALAKDLGEHAKGLYKQIAQVLLDLNRPDLAIFYAQESQSSRLRAYLMLKDYAKASVLLRQKYAKSNNVSELMYSYIYALIAGLIHDSAELDALIAKYGANADIYNSYGYYLLDNNQAKKGLEMIYLALKAEPNNAYYMDSLAWGLYRLGRCDEALDAIERAIEIGVDESAMQELKEHLKEIQKCKI